MLDCDDHTEESEGNFWTHFRNIESHWQHCGVTGKETDSVVHELKKQIKQLLDDAAEAQASWDQKEELHADVVAQPPFAELLISYIHSHCNFFSQVLSASRRAGHPVHLVSAFAKLI